MKKNDYCMVKPPRRTTVQDRKIYPSAPPQKYRQTFSDRFPFTPNLSILDLLFCCGPEAGEMI